MKYELCKQAGLNLFKIETDHFPALIKASDVEAMLEEANVVYGVPGGNWCSSDDKESCDNYRARLLLMEEIEKKPLKHEFETSAVSNNEFGKLYTNMIPSSFVGKKVKVTVEEVM